MISNITSEQACSRLLAGKGTAAKLARELGITPSAISQWRRIPTERVAAVSAIVGIPAADLRPDLAAAFLSAQS
jgi:DNA-binding transcriptional regulator YdaS (Cro superfamily)